MCRLMRSRLLLFGTSVLLIAAASACSDPFAVKANVAVFDDTIAVYGLSEAPPGAPTALYVASARPVSATPSQNYDLVFDVRRDSSGTMRGFVLPPKVVALFGSAGILRDSVHVFDDIKQAPVSGYDDSTAVAVTPGDVLLIQARTVACSGEVLTQRQVMYAKIVIDSVNTSAFDPITNPAGSSIYFRIRVDPNCGFISFADGIPTF